MQLCRHDEASTINVQTLVTGHTTHAQHLCQAAPRVHHLHAFTGRGRLRRWRARVCLSVSGPERVKGLEVDTQSASRRVTRRLAALARNAFTPRLPRAAAHSAPRRGPCVDERRTQPDAVDLAGPSDDVVPWSSSSEPLVLCCGASSVYNTDEDDHSNGVTSASIQAARTAVACAARRPPKSSSLA